MADNKNTGHDLKTLTNIFKDAGATDPESWARSEIEEGINQLARFSFLKAITSEILKESDLEWVNNQIDFDYIRIFKAGDPHQMHDAIIEMLDKNVSRESIVDLVRVIQFYTLDHVCSIIDRNYKTYSWMPVTPIKDWALFEVAEDGNPTRQIGHLTESLMQFDPSGKEFRPRGY